MSEIAGFVKVTFVPSTECWRVTLVKASRTVRKRARSETEKSWRVRELQWFEVYKTLVCS